MKTPVRRSLCLSRRALFGGTAMALLLPTAAHAATVRVSVAEFPDALSTPTLIEMVRCAATKTPGVNLEVTTAPFMRSLAAAVDGSVDIHLPFLRPPHPEKLPFALTDAYLCLSAFVLYTNKDRPLTIAELHESREHKIETDVTHVTYFDFPMVGGANAESSLKKLDAGRIDAYIFAGPSTDTLLQSLGLKNIHRTFYQHFEVVGALATAARGGPADRWFDTAVGASQNDPTFVALVKKFNSGYLGPDWQTG